jgi:hypothetical protein
MIGKEKKESPDRVEELLDLVKQQQGFLEMFARSWSLDYRSGGGSVFCGKGCRNCCSLAVHAGFAEALAVARHLDQAQKKAVESYATKLGELVQGVADLKGYLRLHRQEMGFCPFLDDAGACSVYQVRPLSCRSLISTRESVWCGTDFSRIGAAERDAFVESLDREVVAFPSHYVAVLQETGKELEGAGTKRMSALFGFALYGNLGVLIHLIDRYRLLEACLEGRAEAAGAIAEAGFAHPLLVTVS